MTDPDASKSKDREDKGPESGKSARDRVDSLSTRSARDKTSPPGQSPSTKSKPKPALTEKQRIEARRKRQAARRQPEVKGNPLSKGLRVIGFEVRRTASFLGSALIAALASLGPVFSAAGMGLVWLLEQAGRGLKFLFRITQRIGAAAGRLIAALDRVITPQRAMILVGALGAVLLGVSQFKGLGAVEIGQTGYSGIQDLARAPAIDRTTPAGEHTKILVPIAAIALFAVVVIALGTVASLAARFSRWRRLSSMVLITIGILTLIVTLLIDLPAATDTSEASLAYAGAKAILLSGFWLELAAGLTLTIAGLALILEPLPQKKKSRQRERRPSTVAGSKA